MRTLQTSRVVYGRLPTRLLARLLATLALAACGSDPVSSVNAPSPLAPRSVAVRIVDGDVQVGVAGSELADPLRVQVVDQANRPVSGYVVNFRVVAGGGTVFAGSAATDAQGRAAERWTLGPQSADTQRVEVRAVDPATGFPIVFGTFRAITGSASASAVRVVLTWGSSPSDLDAELDMPTADGGRFVVSSSDAGRCGAAPFACKDVDVITGRGPETITITRQNAGVYRYGVGNYSGETALSASGARVDVYLGGQLARTFTVPSGSGTRWDVFELSGGQITAVNRLSFATPGPGTAAPVATVAVSPATATVSVGGTQQLAAQLRDAAGNALTGRTIAWTSSNAAVATVDAEGTVRGVAAGSAVVTATSEGRTGTAAVQVSAAGAQRIAVVSENPATVPLGTRIAIRARVTDAAGAPQGGVTVTWEQDGFVPITQATDATGEAGVLVPTDRSGTFGGVFYIGALNSGGTRATYTYTVSGGTGGGNAAFDIEVRYVGNVPAGVRTAVQAAVTRLRSIITTSVGTQTLASQDMSFCESWIPTPLSATVSNHLLFVTALSIDGPGKVLARAGGCLGWNNSLVGVSRAEVDVADAQMDQARLNEVMLHELLHALGIASGYDAWDALVLRAGPDDPVFAGENAVNAWRSVGGTRWNPLAVPLEAGGGDGTASSHWREDVLDSELMTGYLDGGQANPLSVITIGALRDLGYRVDPGAADPYVVPTRPGGGGGVRAWPAVPVAPFDEVLRRRRVLPDRAAAIPTARRRP